MIIHKFGAPIIYRMAELEGSLQRTFTQATGPEKVDGILITVRTAAAAAAAAAVLVVDV